MCTGFRDESSPDASRDHKGRKNWSMFLSAPFRVRGLGRRVWGLGFRV